MNKFHAVQRHSIMASITQKAKNKIPSLITLDARQSLSLWQAMLSSKRSLSLTKFGRQVHDVENNEEGSFCYSVWLIPIFMNATLFKEAKHHQNS